METKENQTVYKCEFCKKHYLHKHHATKHELKCRFNPNNRHKCFEYCVHLEKEKNPIYTGGDSEYIKGYETNFFCKKYQKSLHSYKAEHSNNRYLKEVVEETERMPLTCVGYCDIHN